MRKYLILSFILSLASCSAHRMPAVANSQYRDSVVTHHSTPIVQPPDTSQLMAELRCDSLGQVYIARISQLVAGNHRLRLSLDSAGRLSQQLISVHDTVFLQQRTTAVTKRSHTAHSLSPSLKPRHISAIIALLILLTITALVQIIRNPPSNRRKQ